MNTQKACKIFQVKSPPRSKKELRKIFLKLAVVYHPDKATGTHDKMTDLTVAYKTLLECCYEGSGATQSELFAPEQRANRAECLGRTWLPWQKQRPSAMQGVGTREVDITVTMARMRQQYFWANRIPIPMLHAMVVAVQWWRSLDIIKSCGRTMRYIVQGR